MRTPINQPKTAAELDLLPKTKNTCSMSWPIWDNEEGIPDLAPSHISTLLYRPRDMLEHYAEVLTSGKDVEFFSLSDMICKAFDYMQEKALKELNKVFKFVKDNYVTMEFIDPLRRFPTFVAYATPTNADDIKQIYKDLLGRVDLIAMPGTKAPEESMNSAQQLADVQSSNPEESNVEESSMEEVPNCCYFAYLTPVENPEDADAVTGFVCYCPEGQDRETQICRFKPVSTQGQVCSFAEPNPHTQSTEDAYLCGNTIAQDTYVEFAAQQGLEEDTEDNSVEV